MSSVPGREASRPFVNSAKFAKAPNRLGSGPLWEPYTSPSRPRCTATPDRNRGAADRPSAGGGTRGALRPNATDSADALLLAIVEPHPMEELITVDMRQMGCCTTRPPNSRNQGLNDFLGVELERETGFEPATSTLARSRSTK